MYFTGAMRLLFLKLVPWVYSAYTCAQQCPSSMEEMELFGFLPQDIMQTAVLFHPLPSHGIYSLPAFEVGLECFTNINWDVNTTNLLSISYIVTSQFLSSISA